MPKKLAPGIYVYSNDKISGCIDLIKENIEPFLNYGMLASTENGQFNSYVDTNIRKVKVFSFGKTSLCHEDDPINIFKKILEEITNETIDSYRQTHAMGNLLKNHDWEIMKYDEGSFFKNHIDDSATHSRLLSIVVYFNDDYDGGEIEFPGFNILYKPQSGDIIVFPSSFIYNHNVKVITKGIRYAAVNWFSYAKPNK